MGPIKGMCSTCLCGSLAQTSAPPLLRASLSRGALPTCTIILLKPQLRNVAAERFRRQVSNAATHLLSLAGLRGGLLGGAGGAVATGW